MRKNSKIVIERSEDWVDAIPLGTRIVADDGYSRRFGKVYGRIRTRWGSSLRVKFDDYSFDTCPHINSGPGIGWHLIRKLPGGGFQIGGDVYGSSMANIIGI